MTTNQNQDAARDGLLPCPFCGAEVEQFAGDTFCTNKTCGAIIQSSTKAESGRRWNTRATQPLPAANSVEMGDVVKRVAMALWNKTMRHKLLSWEEAGGTNKFHYEGLAACAIAAIPTPSIKSDTTKQPSNAFLQEQYAKWRQTETARGDIEVSCGANDLIHTGYCGGYRDAIASIKSDNTEGQK